LALHNLTVQSNEAVKKSIERSGSEVEGYEEPPVTPPPPEMAALPDEEEEPEECAWKPTEP
jgi:hypothetical protein